APPHTPFAQAWIPHYRAVRSDGPRSRSRIHLAHYRIGRAAGIRQRLAAPPASAVWNFLTRCSDGRRQPAHLAHRAWYGRDPARVGKPLRLAEDLATVDLLAGGRINPGVSVGEPMHYDTV
ncbi:monooxygenase, partial [Arthrobacter sp. DR-2P]